MILEMSVMIMKSNWVMDTRAGFPPLRTTRKANLEKISPQSDIYTMKVDIFHEFDSLLTVLFFTF